MPLPKKSSVLQSAERAELLQSVAEGLARQRSGRGALFNARVAELLGLNLTDLKCFDLLIRAETPLNARQLADRSGLTTAAVTGVIDRLENGGFVKRQPHPTDRRQLILEVQPSAAQRVDSLYLPLRTAMTALAESYSNAELLIIADYQQRSMQIMAEAVQALEERSAE